MASNPLSVGPGAPIEFKDNNSSLFMRPSGSGGIVAVDANNVPVDLIASPGNAPGALMARSASLMGGLAFGYFFDDLNEQTLTNWTTLGTPVLDATHGFGVWTCVNTNNTLALKTLAAVVNPSVTPWHFACRMRIATAPGAAEIKTAALRNSGGNDYAMVGVLGATSTTKFVFRVNTAGAPSNALSTVNLDTTNFHVCEMWFDGVNVYGSVDGEMPVLVCGAALCPTVFLSDTFGVFAAAGGALGMYVDYFYSAAARTAT